MEKKRQAVLSAQKQTGNHRLSEIQTLKIYPNPATNTLTVDLQSGDYSVSIISSIGQQVFYKNEIDGVFSIDLSLYPKGMYIIEVLNDRCKLRSKFVKD